MLLQPGGGRFDRAGHFRLSGCFTGDRAGHLTCMFPAENLRDWRGEKVIDPDGDKIGDLEAVYVDTASDQPAWMTGIP